MSFLGIDTSNYRTSAALYGERELSYTRLLPVKRGELGLRQSDCVFLHIKALPELLERIASETDLSKLEGVGVSVRPRDTEGSYMPCFLAGESIARAVASARGVPLYRFSHQSGHMAAGAWSAGMLELLCKPCLVWHVSGGTTELLLNSPSGGKPSLTRVGGSSDLNAGQLIDRIGVAMGLGFPSGAELEALAANGKPHEGGSRKNAPGLEFSLSGMQNQADRLLSGSVSHEDVARSVMDWIGGAVIGATGLALERFGNLPVLCVGGVFSNKRLCGLMQDRFNAVTSLPAYSGDNAMGAAVLAACQMKGFGEKQ